jgi:hypothetical protein
VETLAFDATTSENSPTVSAEDLATYWGTDREKTLRQIRIAVRKLRIKGTQFTSADVTRLKDELCLQCWRRAARRFKNTGSREDIAELISIATLGGIKARLYYEKRNKPVREVLATAEGSAYNAIIDAYRKEMRRGTIPRVSAEPDDADYEFAQETTAEETSDAAEERADEENTSEETARPTGSAEVEDFSEYLRDKESATQSIVEDKPWDKNPIAAVSHTLAIPEHWIGFKPKKDLNVASLGSALGNTAEETAAELGMITIEELVKGLGEKERNRVQYGLKKDRALVAYAKIAADKAKIADRAWSEKLGLYSTEYQKKRRYDITVGTDKRIVAKDRYQSDERELIGIVRDARGLPVSGAIVRLAASGGQPVQATTNMDGWFTFAEVVAGDYEIAASVAGFQEARKTVRVSDVQRVSIALQLCESFETFQRRCHNEAFDTRLACWREPANACSLGFFGMLNENTPRLKYSHRTFREIPEEWRALWLRLFFRDHTVHSEQDIITACSVGRTCARRSDTGELVCGACGRAWNSYGCQCPQIAYRALANGNRILWSGHQWCKDLWPDKPHTPNQLAPYINPSNGKIHRTWLTTHPHRTKKDMENCDICRGRSQHVTWPMFAQYLAALNRNRQPSVSSSSSSERWILVATPLLPGEIVYSLTGRKYQARSASPFYSPKGTQEALIVEQRRQEARAHVPRTNVFWLFRENRTSNQRKRCDGRYHLLIGTPAWGLGHRPYGASSLRNGPGLNHCLPSLLGFL